MRHDRDAVAAAALEHAPDAIVVDQDEVPGTGRALEVAVAALGGFEGDVLVVNGDLPHVDADTMRALRQEHVLRDASATVLSAFFADPTGAGRIVRDADGAFLRIVEERDASPEERDIAEGNGGVYLFRTRGARRAARGPRHRERAGRAVHHRPRRRDAGRRRGSCSPCPPRTRPSSPA